MSLTIETKKKLVQLGMLENLQLSLVNIMNVLEIQPFPFVDDNTFERSDQVVSRILFFIALCDINYDIRDDMFALSTCRGILPTYDHTEEHDALNEFIKFMTERYKNCKGKAYTFDVEEIKRRNNK